jgi:hypothetical protein
MAKPAALVHSCPAIFLSEMMDFDQEGTQHMARHLCDTCQSTLVKTMMPKIDPKSLVALMSLSVPKSA